MRKNKILPTIVLTAICVAVAALLALANMLTAPVIEAAQREKEAEALRVVYSTAESFEPVELEGKGLPVSITAAYVTDDGGYVFKSEVKGYKDGLVIMVGVSADGKIVDTKYVESQETNGAENELDGAYNGMSGSDIEAVLIGGSTKTSQGYKNAVSDSLASYEILKGDGAK